MGDLPVAEAPDLIQIADKPVGHGDIEAAESIFPIRPVRVRALPTCTNYHIQGHRRN
jgi:hypothetical protein